MMVRSRPSRPASQEAGRAVALPGPRPWSVAPPSGSATSDAAAGSPAVAHSLERISIARAPASATQTPIQRNGNRNYGTFKKPSEEEVRRERREAEKRSLLRSFDIGDHKGEKKPNQLSQVEFDQVAKLYSDIREGGTQIRLRKPEDTKENPLAGWEFEHDTMNDIAKILRTPSGRSLLGTLATGEKKVTLHHEPNPRKARQTSQRSLEDFFGLDPVDAQVHYAPGKDFGSPEDRERDLFGTSDTILFHELTHALHTTTGSRQVGKMTKEKLGEKHRDIGVDREEYATVGLGAWAQDALTENAYRAQQHQLQKTSTGRKWYKPRKFYRGKKRN